MEFGYNTDVTYEGEEYHVQTEGKFGKKPRVDTLVYKSGSVLQMLSRPNADLSWAAARRAASQKLIKKQHLRVVSMIRKGRFDRLEEEAQQGPTKARKEDKPIEPPKAAATPQPPEPSDQAEQSADATVVLERPFIPRPPKPTPSTDEFLEAAEPASPPAASQEEAAAVTPDNDRTISLSAEDAGAAIDSSQAEQATPLDKERSSEPAHIDEEDAADSFFEDEIDEEDETRTIMPGAADGAPPPQPSEPTATPSGWHLPSEESPSEAPEEEEPTMMAMADSQPHPMGPEAAPADEEPPTLLAADPVSLADGGDAAEATPISEEMDVEEATVISNAEILSNPEVLQADAAPGPSGEPQTPVADLSETPLTMELPDSANSSETAPEPAAEPPDEERTLIADTAELPSLEEALAPSAEPAQKEPVVPKSMPEKKNGRMLVVGIIGIGVIIIGLLALVVAVKLLTMKKGSKAGPRHGGTATKTAPPKPTQTTAAPTVSPTPLETPATVPAAGIDQTIAKARASASSGKSEEALGILSVGIQSTGADARLLVARGRLLADMGRWQEALLDFTAASGKEPENPGASYLAGQAAIELGGLADLRSSIDGLRRMGASFELALLEGQASFIDGKTDEAAALLRKAISEHPDDYRGYLAMGNVLLGLGEKNALPTFLLNAKENFDKASSRAPNNQRVHIAMARQRMAAKATREAIPILQKVISMDASSFQAHLLLGVCYLKQKRPGQALPPLERASELAPSNPEAALLAGTAASKISRQDVAVDYFLNALLNQKRPDYRPYPGVHQTRQSIKTLIGTSIKGALKRNPDDKKALKLLDITVNLR